jgi:hypothetical protein
MKQQFLVARGEAKTDLLIREFAELEKNETSLVGEHVFKAADLEKAAQTGLGELIARLRSTDFFPPAFLAEKLAQAVIELINDAAKESVEVMMDDMTIMKDQEADFVDDELDDDEDIDDLLEDDEIPFEDESDEEEEEDLS